VKQVKSRIRVSEFGEVNTSKTEINAMVNLVEHEASRLDSRFLEPACGDGNFLMEVLNRKLTTLVKKFRCNKYEFEKNSIIVIGSIYGIEILKDNVQCARNKLYRRFCMVYQRYFREDINKELIQSVEFIIKKNIILGDFVTFKQKNSNNPITFCEWTLIEQKLKRRDFTLMDLLACTTFEGGPPISDNGEPIIVPQPIKEYSLVNFDEAYKAC